MQELLFLAHRIPYPPNKGDKIRSWNFLAHLARRHHVHLGCFIDDPHDWAFAGELREICGDCCFVPLDPRTARLRSLRGLIDGRPLTLPYYFDHTLDRWVRGVLAREVTRVFIYCSAMAQYVREDDRRTRRCVADVVDIDSEKWHEYAAEARQPRRWLLAREAARLRDVERCIAMSYDATIVATPAEAALYRSFVPEAEGRIASIGNGVDADYFSPDRSYENPYRGAGTTLAFIGAMDYWPNIDAVTHFVHSILPLVRQRLEDVRFFIIGSNPTPAVKALGNDRDVVVTGRVPDVRPYAAHARVLVAPLRIARGVQNKVLEGMAMAKPVVVSSKALAGMTAVPGSEVLLADNEHDFAAAIHLAGASEAGVAIGERARERVLRDYSWSASLERLDAVLEP